jgi:hypothetical protein
MRNIENKTGGVSDMSASKKTKGRRSLEEEASPTLNQSTSGQQHSGQKDLLQHAKKATGEIVNQVQQRANSALAQQTESAATDLTSVVNAVRRFGESLSEQEMGPIARCAAEYGGRGADNLERFTEYIRQQDSRKLLGDVQDFGRRRPTLMLGGAFLLGLACARLIKSSMVARSDESFDRDMTPIKPQAAQAAL